MSMQGALCYSIDTSALVDWWVRYYPPKVFKGLVPRMEKLIEEGRLRCSCEVREEIKYENDGLKDWLKNQGDMCLESSEEIQQIVIDLMDQFHNPLKPEKGINGADPFVIGLAVTQGEFRPWTVVSGEKAGSSEAPKIPWVCGHWNGPLVPHMTFLELIVAEGWELS
jgi:hypothetical protein